MATLYESAVTARKVVFAVLVFVVVILGYNYISALFQSAPINVITHFSYYLDPDQSLGNIPKLSIQPIATDTSVQSTYAKDGIFSFFPDSAYVYEIDKPREKLTTVEDAIRNAGTLGFTTNCIDKASFIDTGDPTVDKCVFDGDNYQWTGAKGTKTLKFNKTTQVWNMTTDYFKNVNAKALGFLDQDFTTYQSGAAALMGALSFNTYGMGGSARIEFAPADLNSAGSFYQPEKQSQSKYMFLEVYRKLRLADLKSDEDLKKLVGKDLIGVPPAYDGVVYSEDPRNGQFRIVAGNNLSNYTTDVFSLDFIDYNYSQQTGEPVRGIYQIISVDEAWTKAQTGGGVLVYLIPQNANPFETYPGLKVDKFVVDATQTSLGYYEPTKWTGYVEPIFIFKGRAELDDGTQAAFTIYVDAIKRLQ